MRRLYKVFLLSILILLLGGTAVWMLRLKWLPYLLYLFAERYDIERIRYEAAEWNIPNRINFYNLRVERGGWMLEADTLCIQFYPGLSIWGSTGSLHKREQSLSPVNLTSGAASYFSSDKVSYILRRLSQIDTLIWRCLTLPAYIEIAIWKGGDSLRATLSYGGHIVPIRAVLREEGLAFTSICGYISTESGSYASWDTINGWFHAIGDSFAVALVGKELLLFHRRIASRPLWYAAAGLHIQGHARAESLFIEIALRELPLRARLHLWAPLSMESFGATLEIPRQSHTAFLEAFPEGFFSCLHRAELAGTSAFQATLTYDPTLADTLDLSIDWQPEGFAIRRWAGPITPLTLQHSFVYRPYRSARSILIDPESPTYLTYRQITPYVLHAVLHGEDGLFFYHQGFQKEAFLKAIMENWRCRCFRRGAGTITMQLVRNLLLTREKTLARKVEEILLTALIERFRLLSKQRIAELYLNIVEWGPEVYGLVEAARFYFGKEPHELTIPEAIFLGVLLPSPRAYKYFIDPHTGCAASSLRLHFWKIAYFLERQHYLHPDSVEAVLPERACLRAPAWVPPDTVLP